MTRLTRSNKSLSYGLVLLIAVLIVMSLASCGPNHYLRKSKRAELKAIQLGAIVKPDTVYKTITVTVPEVKTDTIFSSTEGDTVVIQKDRLTIRYINLPADSVWIYGECSPDTVFKEVPYTVTREIICPPKDSKWKWIALALGAVLILAVVVKKLG